MGRKFVACALLLMMMLVPVLGAEDVYSQVLSLDSVITYGDAGFRERILARTEGQRDPLGLVMTGSWASASAHLGVLYYLEEQSMLPDFIIANSASAPIAILYSAGAAPEDIAHFLERLDIPSVLRLTLPVEGGFFDTSSLEALFEDVLGRDTLLEDLRIPVMVIAEDLVTEREVRVAEGNAARIAVAAMSYPAIFPPIEYNGHLLIDSAISTAAPLDVAYQYTDTVMLSTAFGYDSGSNLLNPMNADALSIPVKQRAAADIRSRDGIIWVNTNPSGYGSLDFSKAYEIGVLGYEGTAMWSDSIALIDVPADSFPQASRDVMKEAMDSSLRNLCFGRVTPSRGSHVLSVDFDYGPFDGGDSYLTDASNLAFRYSYRNSWFEGGGDVGFVLDTNTINTVSAAPMAGGFVGFYPFSLMRITFDLQAEFILESPYIPELYGRQGLDLMILNESWYGLSFHEGFEYRTGFTGPQALVITAGIDGDVRPLDWLGIDASAGYMLTSDTIEFAAIRHFVQVSADFRFDIPPLDNQLYFRLGVKSRIAADGLGGVPLFQADGYLSPNILANENYYNKGVSGTGAMHATIISIYAGWDIPGEPSVGSVLFIEDSEIGAYCDMLLRGSEFSVSAGVQLQTSFSLMKTAKLPLRLRLGYDSWAGSFASSFSVGLEF